MREKVSPGLDLHGAWTGFDLDLDSYVAHEATRKGALAILQTGAFSCSVKGHQFQGDTLFYEGLKQGRLGQVYFIKPKKNLISEQRQKGYRLEYGFHERGGKFYAVGPLLRMDGTRAPVVDHCTIQAGDSFVIFSDGDDELAHFVSEMGAESHFLEDLNDFSNSALYGIKLVKAKLWDEHYKAMRAFLREGKSFSGENLKIMMEHLPVEMKNLSGVRQNFGHLGLDPLEHTFIALQVLEMSSTLQDLEGITLGDVATCDEIARCAVLFHDLGKKLEPYDPYHAELSGRMCEFHLGCMGYNELEIMVIKRLVETHDVMGRVRKGEISCLEGYRAVCNGLPPPISPEIVVKLHCEVAGADIGSIPYLYGVRIEKERTEMLRLARLEKGGMGKRSP